VTADIDLLKRLQHWYGAHCDGSWEHRYGVSIDTLDNPGWSLVVDLTDTELADRVFDEVRVERGGDGWYRCKVFDRVFEGSCGPMGLNELIGVFLNWADPSPPSE
jgi:immunity protein 53 of polymorphic toxin system